MNRTDTELQRGLDGISVARRGRWTERTDGSMVCCDGDRPVATYYPSEHRFSWHHELGEELGRRVAEEQAKYDSWSGEKTIPPGAAEEVGRWFDFPLYDTRAFRMLFKRWPRLTDMRGLRILDIGGSCIDSWRFLASGCERIDHVEVSAGSQQLARRRLDAMLHPRSVEWRGRVWFHTVPAESLPFHDSVFDVVFSRATIHHTKRPDAFREIHRVLKKAGVMFIVEPRRTWLAYRLMQMSRQLRRVDRGTDDPLTTYEILSLSSLFDLVDWYPYNVGSLFWRQTVGRLVKSRRIGAAVNRLDDAAGNAMGLGYALGRSCWIVAQK